MPRAYLAIIGTAITVAMLVALTLLGGGTSSTIAQEATVVPLGKELQPVPTEMYPPAPSGRATLSEIGVPAIRARSGVASGQPAFMPADVVEYLKNTPFPYRAAGKPEPIVERIEFLSTKDVKERFQIAMLSSDDTPVCLVTLSGDFFVEEGITGTRGYLAFDATTGNLLFESVHP